jgi:superfamily II DNA or RNA helicase
VPLHIEFIADEVLGRLSADKDVPHSTWGRIKDSILQFDPDAQIAGRAITAEWRAITAAAPDLAAIRNRHGIAVEYDAGARKQLLRFRDETREIDDLRNARVEAPEPSEMARLLAERGFTRRKLTQEQWRDVTRIVQMRHGANFSVPGAGKTTVALATHLLTVNSISWLVVAPKNAFAAWDEVLEDCLAKVDKPFVRLTGSLDTIRETLFKAPEEARFLISYDQLRTASRLVSNYLLQHPTHVLLDESHRIKAGSGSQRGQAALAIAHLAVRRDILTGTPVPNSISDLMPQLEFLWPSQGLAQRVENTARPRDVLAPFYVRTTKHELKLRPIDKTYEPVPMSEAQMALYSMVKDELLKIEAGIRAQPTVIDLDAARRSVLSLLQIASNAVMYVNRSTGNAPTSYRHDNRTIEALFSAIFAEGDSPKVKRACDLARGLAARGERTVIWSSFTYNVERVAALLADLGATFSHGGVDTGDRDDPNTREGRIKRFHDTAAGCMVLVANPAACSEGISLHRVCHNAIYLDRSFTAGHFLQSIDRIHRLGLPPTTATHVHILESVAPQAFGSIDYSVRRRNVAKLRDMNAVLEDQDLQRLMLDEDTADAPLDFDIDREDIIDVIDQLRGLAPEPEEEDL